MSQEKHLETLRTELKRLLDAVPGSRPVLKHVALIEHVLKNQGLAGLQTLPQIAVEKARLQLHNLPLPAHAVMLPQLLELLTRLALPRDKGDSAPSSDLFMSSFLTDDKLLVTETTLTVFTEMMKAPASPH